MSKPNAPESSQQKKLFWLLKLSHLFNLFFKSESRSGILLIICTVIALAWANSPLRDSYINFNHWPLFFSIRGYELHSTPQFWINDGLMAIFFLLVGLEIKRELLNGELSSIKKASLPIVAAIGGMLVPGIIFCLINLFHGSLSYLKGFAIPMATDIAFALGILSLIKTRIPKSLLILLSAIAIVDDLGAILIIGIFYSHDLSLLFCLLSLLIFLILIGLNFFKIQRLELFLFFGLLLWGCLIKSGIHATLAGVLIALTIPTHKDHNLSLLHKLENKLLTPVSYFIIPLFVLFNAGISFQAESLNTADWMNLFQQYYPILLGILLGFLIGKPIGIFCTTWGLTRLNWVTLPQGLSLFHVFGVSLLAGIGFTMSIFISDLAFSPDIKILFFCKLGIFLASIISGAIGLLYLRFKSTASIYT